MKYKLGILVSVPLLHEKYIKVEIKIDLDWKLMNSKSDNHFIFEPKITWILQNNKIDNSVNLLNCNQITSKNVIKL